MVVVSVVFSIQLMFFDLSVQLQWIASEDMGGIRRTVDKLNMGQKQAGNIKKRRKGRTLNMILSKTSCSYQLVRRLFETSCVTKKKIVFSPTKMPCNKSQV